MNKSILAIIGPTGTGKTDVVAQWAQELELEIISLDSALVYRELSIVANKPNADLLNLCPHHVINVCSVNDPFNVAEYFYQSQKAIASVLAKGKVPLILGGTMMYAYVLYKGLSAKASVSDSFRQYVLSQWPTKDKAYAYLKSNHPCLDPNFDQNNTHRVYRALETFLLETSDSHAPIKQTELIPYQYQVDFVGWDYFDKDAHRSLLANRVDRMLREGLIEEIEFLYSHYPAADLSFWRFVGYRQYRDWLEGRMTCSDARFRTIIANCQLAKHQRTWMRKFPLKKMSYYDANGEKEMKVMIKDYADSMKFC